MNKSARRKMTTSLLVAAILTVLLAGTAVAATKIFGLMDFANMAENGPKPLEGAADMIQTDLAIVDGVTVTEGIYAGNIYAVVVDVPFNSMYPEWKLLNAQAGVCSIMDYWKEDGVTFEISGMIDGEMPDTLKMEISLFHPENPQPVRMNAEPDGPIGEESTAADGESPLEYIILPVELKHTQSRDAKLIPQGEGKDWKIIDAKVSMTDYLAALDVTYQYANHPETGMGLDIAMIDVVVFDEQGNRLEGGAGELSEVALEDGSMAIRSTCTLQSLKEMPEKLILQAKFVGEDEWLDKIECKAEAQ